MEFVLPKTNLLEELILPGTKMTGGVCVSQDRLNGGANKHHDLELNTLRDGERTEASIAHKEAVWPNLGHIP